MGAGFATVGLELQGSAPFTHHVVTTYTDVLPSAACTLTCMVIPDSSLCVQQATHKHIVRAAASNRGSKGLPRRTGSCGLAFVARQAGRSGRTG